MAKDGSLTVFAQEYAVLISAYLQEEDLDHKYDCGYEMPAETYQMPCFFALSVKPLKFESKLW